MMGIGNQIGCLFSQFVIVTVALHALILGDIAVFTFRPHSTVNLSQCLGLSSRSSSGSGSRSGLGCGCSSRSHGCSAGSGLLDRDAVSNAIDGNIVVLHGRVLLNQSKSLDVRFLTEPCCRASWADGQHAWCSAARMRPRRLRGRWQPRRSCRQNRRPQQRQRCTPRRRRQQPWPW